MRILAIGRHCSAHYGEQQNNDIFLACLIMARILFMNPGEEVPWIVSGVDGFAR